MFDTKLPPGVTMLQPFSEGFPGGIILSSSDSAFVEIRTKCRYGMGLNYSCAEQWRQIAEEALYHAGRLTGTKRIVNNLRVCSLRIQ